MQQVEQDFLGKMWVPLSLAIVAVEIAACLAMSVPVIGFMLAETTVAASLLLRLSWSRRGQPAYVGLVAALIVLHLLVVAFFHGAFSRAPGGVYMLAALADGLLMTAAVNTLIQRK